MESTLKRQAESVRDGLERELRELWPAHSLFELTSFHAVTARQQETCEIR